MTTVQQAQAAIRAVSEASFLPLLTPQSHITFDSRDEARLYVQASSGQHGFHACVLRSSATQLRMGCISGGNYCSWKMDLALVEEKQASGANKSVWRCKTLNEHTTHQIRSEEDAKAYRDYVIEQRNAHNQANHHAAAAQAQAQAQAQPPQAPIAAQPQQPIQQGFVPPPFQNPQYRAPAPQMLNNNPQAPRVYAQIQLQVHPQPQPQPAPPAFGPPPPSQKALLISSLIRTPLPALLNRISRTLSTPECVQKFSKLGYTQHLFLNLLGYDRRMLEAMANLLGLDETEKVSFLGYFLFSDEAQSWRRVLAERE